MAPLSSTRRVNLIALYTIAVLLLAGLAGVWAIRTDPNHHLVGPFGLQLSYDYGNVLNHHTPSPIVLGINIAVWAILWTTLALTLRTHTSVVALGLVAGGAIVNTTFEVAAHKVPNYITVGSLFTCNAADMAVALGIALLSLAITAALLRRYRARGAKIEEPALPN